MSRLRFKLGLPGYILLVRSWLLSTGQPHRFHSITTILRARRQGNFGSPRVHVSLAMRAALAEMKPFKKLYEEEYQALAEKPARCKHLHNKLDASRLRLAADPPGNNHDFFGSILDSVGDAWIILSFALT